MQTIFKASEYQKLKLSIPTLINSNNFKCTMFKNVCLYKALHINVRGNSVCLEKARTNWKLQRRSDLQADPKGWGGSSPLYYTYPAGWTQPCWVWVRACQKDLSHFSDKKSKLSFGPTVSFFAEQARQCECTTT
jgi:hypothetical protein